MDRNGVLLFIGITIVISAFCSLFYFGNKGHEKFETSCKARGGRVLSGRDILACVDPKIFK